MHTLLIVDDERTAVKGMLHGIDWSALGITDIYEAYNVRQAQEVFASRSMDIMICDIEMPGQSGIELLEWVREHHRDTVSIFLTGHSDFGYVQKALQLGSFDYLLKPVRHEHLRSVTEQALEKFRQNREVSAYGELHLQYVQQWEAQLPYLVERFWQDLINQRILPGAGQLEASLQLYRIPLSPAGGVLPVLLSIERWKEELTARDEEIMEYALRKMASEMILERLPGAVIQDRSGVNLLLLYVEPERGISLEEVSSVCNEYIGSCGRFFQCSLSCYIGEITSLRQLPRMYKELLEMEQLNVSAANSVVRSSELARLQPEGGFLTSHHPVADWIILFELGREEELLELLEERCRNLESKPQLSKEELDSVGTSVLHMLFTAYHLQGLSVYAAFQGKELVDPSAGVRSMAQLRSWLQKVVPAGMRYYQSHRRGDSECVAKIKRYIAKHLSEEFSREDLAACVHLNPSYISRLFKKETGISITDYVLGERMREAKRLLAETEITISEIAESVGYMSLSHFITMFKKVTGITPLNYRKQ